MSVAAAIRGQLVILAIHIPQTLHMLASLQVLERHIQHLLSISVVVLLPDGLQIAMAGVVQVSGRELLHHFGWLLADGHLGALPA